MSVDQDVPLLGLGREQSQAWKQLAVVVAQALQRRRVELGRSAWSAARAAERASEQYGRDLEPRVRAMAAADEAAFRSAAETGAVGFERRSSDGPQFGWMVHTVVGPMPEACPSGGRGAWGLHGHGVSGGTSLSVFVVVADRETAVRLRDEVTGGQQRTLRDLGRLGVYGHDRAEHARTEVRENECVLRARVERSLYAAWPHDGELVAAVMRAPYGEDNPDYTVIDQLAGQLRDLEDRGVSDG